MDTDVIEALYRASRAGVEIELIVRGVCCLRPGVEGMSENIQVRSIIDRFLEHSRVWQFGNGGRPEVYIGSADWMPRNFFKRIEVVFPVEDGVLRERIIEEILARQLADTAKARMLQPDGSYAPAVRKKGGVARRCQTEFMDLANGQRLGTSRSKKPVKMVLKPRPDSV